MKPDGLRLATGGNLCGEGPGVTTSMAWGPVQCERGWCAYPWRHGRALHQVYGRSFHSRLERTVLFMWRGGGICRAWGIRARRELQWRGDLRHCRSHSFRHAVHPSSVSSVLPILHGLSIDTQSRIGTATRHLSLFRRCLEKRVGNRDVQD